MKRKNIVVGLVVVLLGIFLGWKFLASQPVPTYQVGDLQLEVTLSPNPPRVGDLGLKVKILDQKLQPITSAQVKVSSGMPAMGNMPAMQAEALAQLKGQSYETLLSVSMLGTWNLGLNIKTNDGKTQQANFKFSTGQKGLIFYPDNEPAPMDMSANVSMIKLTGQQIKLARVQASQLKKLPIYRTIRAAGVVAFDQELNVAEQEYLASLNDKSVLALTQSKLKLLGLSQLELERLNNSKQPDQALILPGERAWVYADIYEYENRGVAVGQTATIKSLANPEENFSGVVRAIVPVLDPKTRSSRVRIEVLNAAEKLSPNMYVDVMFNVPLGVKLAIPKAAALITGKNILVYVAKGSGYYERRPVVLGPLAYTQENKEERAVYPLISGLRAGELIVSQANFLLDSQSELSGGTSGLYGSGAKEVENNDQQNN